MPTAQAVKIPVGANAAATFVLRQFGRDERIARKTLRAPVQRAKKNGSGKSGAKSWEETGRDELVMRSDSKVARQESGIREVSESEARQIAVAICNLRAGHQSAVDGGEDAAEQARGGRQGDSSGLGHFGLSGCREAEAIPSFRD